MPIIESRVHAFSNYSQAIATAGEFLHISGHVPVTADGDTPADADAQACAVVANIAQVVADAGASLGSIVFLRVFVTTADAVAAWRQARDEAFAAPYPASSLVYVAGLARPDWLIEVEAVAELTGSGA